jgi:cytochrome c peroxidase
MLCIFGCTAVSPEDVAPVGVRSEDLTLAEAVHFVKGGLLYQFETFDGNDRTCGTCHAANSHFDLAPEDVEEAFAEDPEGPLFRSLDSNDGVGEDYSLMRADGLVRVHVVLAPNVTVDEVDGINVQVRPDGRYVVALRRATPTSINSALNDHLMWDGREGTDLAHQALSAALDHAEVLQLPTESELADIAFFQEQLFSSAALREYARGGPEPTLPYGRNDSEERGRAFFLDEPLSASAGTHGLCATCHSGPMLNRTGHFNPGDPPDLPFSGNRTSQFNRRALPEYTYHITLASDHLNDNPRIGPIGMPMWPAGTTFTLQSPDPGVLVVDADPSDGSDGPANPCISTAGCLVAAPGGATEFHRMPTLWGSARTAPYFHDNSAATFQDVARHYREFFAPTQASMYAQADFMESIGQLEIAAVLRDEAGALTITDQDVEDIAAYMRYAFR